MIEETIRTNEKKEKIKRQNLGLAVCVRLRNDFPRVLPMYPCNDL